MPKRRDKGKGGKGTGKGKSKGVCKGSSAGIGGGYAAPGRPKIFRPTDEDRKQTGNTAEYFKPAEKTTPQPLAPVFASGVVFSAGLKYSAILPVCLRSSSVGRKIFGLPGAA